VLGRISSLVNRAARVMREGTSRLPRTAPAECRRPRDERDQIAYRVCSLFVVEIGVSASHSIIKERVLTLLFPMEPEQSLKSSEMRSSGARLSVVGAWVKELDQAGERAHRTTSIGRALRVRHGRIQPERVALRAGRHRKARRRAGTSSW